MHPYRRIPGWLFWPMAIVTTAAWLILIAWLILKLFANADVGSNPLEAIPQLIKAVTEQSK